MRTREESARRYGEELINWGHPSQLSAGCISCCASVAGVDYRYELRRGDEVVATGHLSREEPLEVGERLAVNGQVGIVRTVEALLGERELRLVVQLVSGQM